jgi:putative ABC transport system ATP-binding protein
VTQDGIVKLTKIGKGYGEGAGRVEALRDVSLSVAAGEFLALCGPSGSGKTTLLNLIGALDTPTSGVIEVEGCSLGALSRRELARLRRDRIGFVFQAHNLIPILTAYENAEFTLALQKVPRRERRERAFAALASVGLAGLEDRLPAELSGGQQQRVAIARAIAPRPAIVLADEPTASLDSRSAVALLELMQALNERSGVTFIFSTHDSRVMERARRIVPLVDGRLAPPT